jgi:hypothetical protein
MTRISRDSPPILRDKHHDALSAFIPESLLREARRQKNVSHRTAIYAEGGVWL